MKEKFTATLCINNLRDVHTSSVKILLTNVVREDGTVFRSHCWVIASSFDVLRKRHNGNIDISFTGVIYDYIGGKQSIKKLRNIKLIKG
jgi:hypothetical protein